MAVRGAPVSVTLGGVPATNISVASVGTISFTTPPHEAGPVDVVITFEDGSIVKLSNGYTYLVDQTTEEEGSVTPGITPTAPNTGLKSQSILPFAVLGSVGVGLD